MQVIHSDIPNESHLKGLTEDEKKFIRNLAKIAVEITLNKIDERNDKGK